MQMRALTATYIFVVVLAGIYSTKFKFVRSILFFFCLFLEEEIIITIFNISIHNTLYRYGIIYIEFCREVRNSTLLYSYNTNRMPYRLVNLNRNNIDRITLCIDDTENILNKRMKWKPESRTS